MGYKAKSLAELAEMQKDAWVEKHKQMHTY